MEQELEFYKSYHQNIYNKWIHFFCIPMIILSIIIYINNIYITYKKNDIVLFETKVINWIISLYIISYSTISLEIGMIMMFYFNGLKLLADYLIRKKVDWISKYLFLFGWLFQLIGHYIEGKKPALLDSLVHSFYQAPLFSLEVLLPNLFLE